MGYAKDPRVDSYIDALPEWQQQICRGVRDFVHAADPAVEETIKRRVQLKEEVLEMLRMNDETALLLTEMVEGATGRQVRGALRELEMSVRVRSYRGLGSDPSGFGVLSWWAVEGE